MVICCEFIPNWSAHLDVDDGIPLEDKDANKLSHVGTAVHNALRMKHKDHHHKLWNVTSGKVIGELHQTPSAAAFQSTRDVSDGESDWLPQKMGEILSRTRIWCDLMSLGPPDGLFMDELKAALSIVSDNAQEKESPVIIRMMFGNIVGMPVNCNAVMKELTKDLPENANIHLWVGAWRNGASWNHAKLISVDGKYLHNGGHNMWDPHYLKSNPVHDLSLEIEGGATRDGHLFANQQWAFIQKKQSSLIGGLAENLPDSMPLLWKNRVIVSEYPRDVASEFPPVFESDLLADYERGDDYVPMITMGRSGTLLKKDRPSDDAFIAMIDSAQTIIRLTLQDLGPVCIPNTKIALPGLSWPKPYLDAMARAIWTRGVDVEIVLSNPGSIPGGLGPLEACYGNGWTCNDVASEIIKRIKKRFADADDAHLRQKVEENLRVCFIRHDKSSVYSDGGNIGLHSKFFIVDDVASYTGSQNLYECDLAEWGVVVDDADATAKMMSEYWTPMWEASFTGEDCDVQTVMDGLDIDRDGEALSHMSYVNQSRLQDSVRVGNNFSTANPSFYGKEGL
jgi:phosphatidylserine/phosphatidylglycerophosphate/cardiolipin synthase-like enzyme